MTSDRVDSDETLEEAREPETKPGAGEMDGTASDATSDCPAENPSPEPAVFAENPEDGGENESEDVPEPGEEDDTRLEGIVESLVFAAGSPVTVRRLAEVLKGPAAGEVKRALNRVAERYASHERGIRLVSVAGGYQFRTAPENNEWVRALLRERPARVGRAAMETLALIAYKQPVTRAEIEAIRGVDADSSLSSLLSKRLIKVAGRKETVGRPLLYATTPEFLEVFGLENVKDLPALKEIGPAPETDDDDTTEDGEQEASGLAEAAAETEGSEPQAGFGDAETSAAEDENADAGAGAGEAAEDPEPGGDELAAAGGGDDSGRSGDGERPGGDGAGDAGESGSRPGGG